jgi:hypothetical protein
MKNFTLKRIGNLCHNIVVSMAQETVLVKHPVLVSVLRVNSETSNSHRVLGGPADSVQRLTHNL